MMGYVHVEWIDAVWLVIASAGMWLVVDELRSALADRRLVDEAREGAIVVHGRGLRELELERALVEGDVVIARWLVAWESAILAAGILALFTPAPESGRTVLGWSLIALLTFASAAIPARTFGKRQRRRRLLRA